MLLAPGRIAAFRSLDVVHSDVENMAVALESSSEEYPAQGVSCCCIGRAEARRGLRGKDGQVDAASFTISDECRRYKEDIRLKASPLTRSLSELRGAFSGCDAGT